MPRTHLPERKGSKASRSCGFCAHGAYRQPPAYSIKIRRIDTAYYSKCCTPGRCMAHFIQRQSPVGWALGHKADDAREAINGPHLVGMSFPAALVGAGLGEDRGMAAGRHDAGAAEKAFPAEPGRAVHPPVDGSAGASPEFSSKAAMSLNGSEGVRPPASVDPARLRTHNEGHRNSRNLRRPEVMT